MKNDIVQHGARRAGRLLWRAISVLSLLGFLSSLTLHTMARQAALREQEGRPEHDPVCTAAARGDLSALERWRLRNWPLDAPCGNGEKTALGVAAENGQFEVVAYLLRHGVPANSHGTDNRTPLTLAQLHVYQNFHADVQADFAFGRVSRLLADAGGTTGNARPQTR